MPLISDAIITKFKATVALSAIAGPWFGEAKERLAFPYAVIPYERGTGKEYAFGLRKIQDVSTRIQVWHTNMATLMTYHEAVQTAFDLATLTIASGTFLKCQHLRHDIQKSTTIIAADGSSVYYSTNDYYVKIAS